ncbi:helix-turn-helix domain-containing protein [Paenibacillus oenotherae]|uniref:Helix-turn-helix domain-containing protein n=1 Tax=Paenibacillus oenotherae TaxID=1435645 RepID=A0ABS7DCK5_9BACL|nr:helix-turn-helix domain-containing protein [Paenibacillus oenotherae]MBW7477664.1 helix-turn-helix domain-containing protein [Paenibacillus oenotherae]
MSEAKWMEQLQHILDCPLRQFQLPVQAWKSNGSGSNRGTKASRSANAAKAGDHMAGQEGLIWFALRVDSGSITALEVGKEQLSDTEKKLIGWMISLKAAGTGAGANVSESERYARELGSWIAEQLEIPDAKLSVPDHLMARGRLFSSMIPFLLVCEQAEAVRSSYTELEKLLRSFLAEDVMLIPLKEQEWLVLSPVSLIRDAQSEDRETEQEESVEESLASIAQGLQEMLSSEWIGECHLAVSQPMSPASSIVATTALLRETIHLGRTFHMGANIHLPWLLHLERLLSTIPESQRARFVEQALKRTDFFLEPEILSTLETFFSLDCNVSETAKKLYIHRNTLLYRLDKLKQETELDVRQFSDAVLVKIVLLLYKVTKRK